MRKTRSRLLLVAVLATAVVSACGGGGGGGTTEDISQSSSDLLAFMNRLIAGTDDTSDPTDINSLNLVIDESSDPVAL